MEFAELLTRARKGWQALSERDWQLLESRVCTNHCGQCEAFEDVQMLRPPGGRRRDEVAATHQVWHCPCDDAPTDAYGRADVARTPCVLASRRVKIDALNEAHAARVRARTATVPSTTFEAHDTCESSGRAVTREEVRSAIDDRLSGLPRRLTLRMNQLVLLTVNRRAHHRGFVNGSLATVCEVTAVDVAVRLLDELADAPPLRVRRTQSTIDAGGSTYTRSQIPLVAAHAMTIHRVQGATLTGDVHILLNREIFADGQAYVALSRVQRLSQLHLWCLEREALQANPTVSAEYERLARFPLDDDALACAPERTVVRHLLPLAGAAQAAQ